jgi:hypothetical protein
MTRRTLCGTATSARRGIVQQRCWPCIGRSLGMCRLPRASVAGYERRRGTARQPKSAVHHLVVDADAKRHLVARNRLEAGLAPCRPQQRRDRFAGRASGVAALTGLCLGTLRVCSSASTPSRRLGCTLPATENAVLTCRLRLSIESNLANDCGMQPNAKSSLG